MSYLIILTVLFFMFLFFKTNDANVKIYTLLGCLVLFSGGVCFSLHPKIVAMHIPLYGFLVYALVLKKSGFHEELSAFPLKMGMIFLLMTFLVSGFLGAEGGVYGMYTAFRFFLDSYGFLLVAFLIGYRCDYDKMTKALYWPIIIFCIFGFVEAAMKYNYVYAWLMDAFPEYSGILEKGSVDLNYHDSWRIRTSVTTYHPTTLGALLTMFFIIYLPKIKERTYRIYFLLAVLTVAIYLSGSRSAWVCSAGYLVYYFVKSQSVLIKMFFIFLIIMCVGYVGNAFIEAFSVENRGSSLDMRQRNLLVCIISFAESPVTGHGFNYIGSLVDRRDDGGAVDGAMESVFFNLMVEQGLLGLFAYCFFIGLCLWAFFRMKKYNPEVADVGIGITVMITMISLMSGTLGNLHSMSYLFEGMCLGLLCHEKNKEELDADKEDSPVEVVS